MSRPVTRNDLNRAIIAIMTAIFLAADWVEEGEGNWLTFAFWVLVVWGVVHDSFITKKARQRRTGESDD